MADSAERQLKILLKLDAEVNQAKTQTVGALKEIEAAAISTSKVTGQALNIGALSPQARADLQQTLATGKGIGIFANEAKVAAAGMATNFGIAGLNISRARQEALVLARELAAGNIRASTLSSLMGSMGTSITLAGLAAYELGQFIQLAANEELRFNKEFAKATVELDKQIDKWIVLSKSAGSFTDVAKLGSEIGPALAAASLKLAEFRTQELTLQQKFVDAIAAMWSAIPGQGYRPNQAVLDKARQESAGQLRTMVVDAKALYDTAKLSASAWEQMKLGDAATGIATLNAEIDKLTSKQSALENASQVLPGASDEDVKRAARAFQALVRVNDELKISISHRNELQDIEEKEAKAGDQENRRQQLQAINALLREHAAIISSIREQQQLINVNGFLSTGAKEKLTLASMVAELIQISRAIEETKVAMSNSALDPAKIAQLQAEYKKLQFEADLLKLKISTINLPLSSELANWVNSFGTSAHQIAGLIEGSINTSLQAMNDLIISGQGNVVDLEKKLLGMFLTMLEQMALQQAASLLGITTTTGAQVASGAAITAAHAPAAAATSISSFGAAALVGEIAAIAAIIAIMAALGGGFKRGSYTGDGDENEFAGLVHKKEFVFDASATRSHGIENLELARRGQASIIPHFGSGGRADFIYPPWTFGPSGSRTGYTGPTADSDWFRSYGSRFIPDRGNARFPGYPRIGNLDDDIPPADLADPYYVPPAPPMVVIGPDGLPVGPGGLDEGPGLFPNRGSVTITTRGGAPRFAPRYSPTPNFIGNFGGLTPFGFFSPWSDLGYGTRSNVIIGGGAAPTYNSSLGAWQQFDPVTQSFVNVPPPTRFDPGFIDPATGLPASSSLAPRPSPLAPRSPSPPRHSADYIGYGQSPMARADAMLAWSQSILQSTNLPQADSPDRFQSGIWHMDEFGGLERVGERGSGAGAFSHQLFNSPASIAAYNRAALAWGRHAAGVRIPGPPSRSDTIPAWLSTGEQVTSADETLFMDRMLGGRDWAARLATMRVSMPALRLAAGGRVGEARIADGGSRMAADQPIIVNVHYYNDERRWMRGYEDDPTARKVFRRNLNRYG